MSRKIGISRNINFEWLNQVANLYIEGRAEDEIMDDLNEYLEVEIKSPTNLKKTRGILMNIWAREIEGMEKSKKLAVKLFKTDEKENQLLAHWCLMLMVYPVFADICSTIGKMDRNMFDITNKEIKNRMFDLWGKRSTLYYSIDKNIRTLKDLDVIYSMPENKYGINRYTIKNEYGLILIANVLIYIKDSLYISIDELNDSPEFFPFNYSITTNILDQSNMFSLDRFGGELVVSRA